MTTPAQPDSQPEDTTVVVEDDTITPAEQQALLAPVGRAWWVVLLLGIISLIVGIIVLIRPFTAVNVASNIIFGIWLFVSGVIQLAQAFDKQLETISGSSTPLPASSGSSWASSVWTAPRTESRCSPCSSVSGGSCGESSRSPLGPVIKAGNGHLPRDLGDHRRWCCPHLANRVSPFLTLSWSASGWSCLGVRDHCLVPCSVAKEASGPSPA